MSKKAKDAKDVQEIQAALKALKAQETQVTQETQETQATQETQVTQETAQTVVVPVQVETQPQKKKKTHRFAKFLSIVLMLCMVIGLFLPVYVQGGTLVTGGSVLCGEQTIFAFIVDALKGLLGKTTSTADFLTAASEDRAIWIVFVCTIAVFLMTVITFFSKKHTRGWFFLDCLIAAVAVYPYSSAMNLGDFVKNFNLNDLPGVDLVLVAALLAALFAAIMALFCFLRALFSSKKRATCAVFCFLASVAILVFTYSYKDIAVTSGLVYFGKIAYELAKGNTVTMYITEATAYAATLAVLINVLVEIIRIANGKKAGGFSVFRYLLLVAIAVVAWVLPLFGEATFAIKFTPSLVVALATIVLFIINIIASSHNAKKRKAAKKAAEAAKPQVVVTYEQVK